MNFVRVMLICAAALSMQAVSSGARASTLVGESDGDKLTASDSPESCIMSAVLPPKIRSLIGTEWQLIGTFVATDRELVVTFGNPGGQALYVSVEACSRLEYWLTLVSPISPSGNEGCANRREDDAIQVLALVFGDKRARESIGRAKAELGYVSRKMAIAVNAFDGLVEMHSDDLIGVCSVALNYFEG